MTTETGGNELPKTTKKSTDNFKKWYERNGESYNEKRRAKYATTPELRDAYVARAKEYRKRNPLPPNTKYKDAKRLGDVLPSLGITRHTFITYEGYGVIPAPTLEGGHRFYTPQQVELLTFIVMEMKKLVDSKSNTKNNRDAIYNAIIGQWNKN